MPGRDGLKGLEALTKKEIEAIQGLPGPHDERLCDEHELKLVRSLGGRTAAEERLAAHLEKLERKGR